MMMCFSAVWLIWSMMQAKVVDLPLPAGPVTRTSPFVQLAQADDAGRNMHFFRRGGEKINNPDYGGQGSLLLIGIHPETADAGQREKIIISGRDADDPCPVLQPGDKYPESSVRVFSEAEALPIPLSEAVHPSGKREGARDDK